MPWALIGRRLAPPRSKTAAWVLVSRVLQNVNGLLLSVLLVRRFGVAAAGTLAVATTAVVVLGLLCTCGLTYSFARDTRPIPQRNALGLVVACAAVPFSLPVAMLLGLLTGQSFGEQCAIALFALGGPFFAQCNLVNALQILSGRAGQSVVAPLANFAGLGVAALVCTDLVSFAALLGLVRFAGVFAAFLLLPRQAIALREVWREVRGSVRFLTADGINLGTEQLTVLVVSSLISRPELGLIGLGRQLLTVSDTPGWSQMQAHYPAAVREPATVIAQLRRTMLRLGAVCGLAVGALSIPLGLWVYGVRALALLGPLLLSSVPLRYWLGVQDMHLRAVGATGGANGVSVLRCILGFALIPGGAVLGSLYPGPALYGGAFGTVLGIMLHTLLSVLLTGRATRSWHARQGFSATRDFALTPLQS